MNSSDQAVHVDEDRSWIRLYRKMADSAVFQNPELLKVWIWCLFRANHKESWIPVATGRGETVVTLKPGQFLFGRESASEKLGMPASSIRNRMEKLKNLGNLDIKADTHYSIVTIINWDTYQYGCDDDRTPKRTGKGQPKDNQRTGKGQAKDTDKNDKNEENEENEENLIPSSPVGEASGCPPPKAKKDGAPLKEKKPRERDEFFDGLSGLFNIDPHGGGPARIGRLKKLFLDHGADFEEVERRAKIYQHLHPTWTFSGEAVEKHWGELEDTDGIFSDFTPDAVVDTIQRPMVGFDFCHDDRHIPIWQAEADKFGMTLREYADWRYAYYEKNGRYTPEHPVPEVDPPSLEPPKRGEK